MIEVKSDITTQWKEVLKTANELDKIKRNVPDIALKNGLNINKIPLFVVSYNGWKKIDTITTHFNHLKNIYGIFNIDSMLYKNLESVYTKESSMWMFINDIIRLSKSVDDISIDIKDYLNSKKVII